ncbi:hypothetical protein FS749_006565 [Ceratobasidium sp. UAMH 11750]|nr:hypothetical protein FS749_006565 [Ceratobasidium sp. UAMH 11750]
MAPPPSKPVAGSGLSTCKAKGKDKAPRKLTPEAVSDNAPAPAAGKGHRQGVKNLSAQDKLAFVRIIKELLLISPAAWEQVYKMYNKKHQPHTIKMLKGIWPLMEKVVKLTREVDIILNVAIETKTLNDNTVPCPVVSEEDQEGKGEDEGDEEDLGEDDEQGKENNDGDNLWVLTEDEAAAQTEPGVSKKTAIIVTGTLLLQEVDVKPKPCPKPKAHPQPVGQNSPAKTATTSTPAHAAATSTPAKVEAGLTNKVKGKDKAAPVESVDTILKVTSDSDSEIALLKPLKHKAKAEPADNARMVRRKPEIDTTGVRTAAACTRQNSDTLITHMLDTFNPVYAKQATKVKQTHTCKNMVIFNLQQCIQKLESQLAEANQCAGDKHEKYFNTHLELSQAQMWLAMHSHLGFGGAGAAPAGFGMGPAASGAAAGLPGVYALIPQFQVNNSGVGAHPGVPNTPYNIIQLGIQQPGKGFGAYNPPAQPSAFPTALDSPVAPTAPAAPMVPVTPITPPTPTVNVQAPTLAGTPNTQNAGPLPS